MLDLSRQRLETIEISEPRPISTFAVKRGKIFLAYNDASRISIFDAASGHLAAQVDLGQQVLGRVKVSSGPSQAPRAVVGQCVGLKDHLKVTFTE